MAKPWFTRQFSLMAGREEFWPLPGPSCLILELLMNEERCVWHAAAAAAFFHTMRLRTSSSSVMVVTAVAQALREQGCIWGRGGMPSAISPQFLPHCRQSTPRLFATAKQQCKYLNNRRPQGAAAISGGREALRDRCCSPPAFRNENHRIRLQASGVILRAAARPRVCCRHGRCRRHRRRCCHVELHASLSLRCPAVVCCGGHSGGWRTAAMSSAKMPVLVPHMPQLPAPPAPHRRALLRLPAGRPARPRHCSRQGAAATAGAVAAEAGATRRPCVHADNSCGAAHPQRCSDTPQHEGGGACTQ